MIEDQLADSGIGCDFVYVPGDTRTNITILERSTHTHTQLALSGPTLPADAPSQLLDRLKRRVRNDTWLALAGSIPPPGDPQVYVDLIAMAAERGGRTALDADGPVVEAVLHSESAPPSSSSIASRSPASSTAKSRPPKRCSPARARSTPAASPTSSLR